MSYGFTGECMKTENMKTLLKDFWEISQKKN